MNYENLDWNIAFLVTTHAAALSKGLALNFKKDLDLQRVDVFLAFSTGATLSTSHQLLNRPVSDSKKGI